MGWFGGGKKEEIEEEDDDLEPVRFLGSMSGAEANLKANQRLVEAGLPVAKDIVTDAISQRADSLRIDPKGPQAVITLTIDGIPTAGGRLSKNEGLAATQMLKLLAGLDPKVRDKAQSGGIRAEWETRKYNLHINSIPVQDGERLIMRISDVLIKLDKPTEVGMSEALRVKLREIGTGTGMLLCCGPSGSGTTTTTFAALRGFDPYLYSVYTFGDQMGRPLDKDNIVKYSPNSPEETYGASLERMARQEANVVYIDPIKTADTAKLCLDRCEKILLVAELPAKDVCQAVKQLLDWSGNPKLVAGRLRGILSQKLLRLLCSECKQAYKPKADFIKKAGLAENVTTLFRKAQPPEDPEEEYEPCEKCDETGYFGRSGLFEFLEMTEDMQKLVATNPTVDALRAQMKKEKMLTFQQDALRVIGEGRTSLEEVQRVFKSA